MTVETHFPATGVASPVTPVELAKALLAEAERTNERRLIALAGEAEAGVRACHSILDALPIGIADTVAITEAKDAFRCEKIAPERSIELMGTTRRIVVVDLHRGTIPNVIGRATGAVDGGGLLVLLCPAFAAWPERRDAFDESLVVAPATIDDVRGGFKRRLVATLGDHPGVAVLDVDTGSIQREGLTGTVPAPSAPEPGPPPADAPFPPVAYERCLTRDQRRVLEAFERLTEDGHVVVVSAERGRGKSSAAGLAAGALAAEGERIVVTAPEPANTRAFFARARELVADIDGTALERPSTEPIETEAGGRIDYLPPMDALAAVESDSEAVLFVDEAAGLPVRTLERYLVADRVAYTTTRYGYEGSGHGFSVRFRASLTDTRHEVTDVQMEAPIRYARDDPIESWANRALLLDARPPVAEAIADATTETVEYRRITAAELERDDRLLRDVLGLLAMAHYRTEPDDLARILDAPNLAVAALEHGDHVASVALLAREGNLPQTVSEAAYAGERIRGNMLPDVFIDVFRDVEMAERAGLRVVRIATHPAVRRRGLASAILDAIRGDWVGEIDWFGTGFGATPGLVRFWSHNGFVPISLSATRNRASGAYSVMMLDGGSAERYAADLPCRLRESLSDVHRGVEPEVIIAVLAAIPAMAEPTIADAAWRRLTAAADGPGQYDLDPGPARRLIAYDLVARESSLSPRAARLLVAKVLQGRSWVSISDSQGYASVRECRRSIGKALSTLLDTYGSTAVDDERRALAHGPARPNDEDDTSG